MRRLLPLLLAVSGTFIAAGTRASAQTAAARPPYPPTRESDVADEIHGVRIRDPYRWLEDVDSPETRAWVEAQNALTRSFLDAIPERARIRDRLTKLWDYPRYGAPFKEGKRLFYFENTGLQNQAVLYVQDRDRKDRPRILLDPNALSGDGTVAVTSVAASRNARYLAYGTAASGSDWQEFHVRDVESGKDLADTLRWIKFSRMSWTRDNKGFYYSRYDAPASGAASGQKLTTVNRGQKLYYHRLGTTQSTDGLIFERPDQPDWLVDAQVTDDGAYCVITINQGADERDRIYFVDLDSPGHPRVDAPVVRLLDDFDASYEFIDNGGPVFLFLTDRDAPKGRIIAVNINAPAERDWRTIVPEQNDALSSVKVAGNTLVASYLQDAHTSLRFFTPLGSTRGELSLPGLGTVTEVSASPLDPEFFYAFSSFLSPTTVYRYDLRKGTNELFKTPLLDVDLSRFETTQVFYTSRDGTRVPMFLTARKGMARDGNSPTLLYAYGGFNNSVTPAFSPATLVWLEMGGVYAVANIRGGGEYGREWHEGGMLAKKQNVFDDFIAAAEFLVRERYTSPARLAVQGASNGGLLVGAAMTQRPELFGAALPAVGVMDMLRFDKFTIGWAWTSEYGSADDSAQFRVLRAYSPLHNITRGTHFPATLITTADHDDRVVPGHSFKFAAALQAAQGGPAPVLIRIEAKAGHGAGMPTGKLIDEAADRFAFLAKVLGIGRVLTP
jgi:prolyl oligopeptidase